MAFKAISKRKGIVRAVSIRLCPESPRLADARSENPLESRTGKSEFIPQPPLLRCIVSRQCRHLLDIYQMGNVLRFSKQLRYHRSPDSTHLPGPKGLGLGLAGAQF